MTEPLTFSSPPSAYPRTNLEARGALKVGARHAAGEARGKSCADVSMCVWWAVGWQQRLTVRDNLEDNMVYVYKGRCSGGWRQQEIE
jgi:hypothetical protein